VDAQRHQDNRRAWNAATEAHNSHKRDQAAFLRQGGSTLFPEEVKLLGELDGLRLVHLQCNAGQDTLSLARLGAEATGVDISDDAIQFARRLSRDAGIPAEFARADVYDWLRETAESERRYDVAFCSYGALPWLSDLEAWAEGIAGVLEPGGRLVLVEFHPVAMTFGDGWERQMPYFYGGEPLSFDSGIDDYVAASGAALTPSGYEDGVRDFENPHPCHEWIWTLSEVLGALTGAGFAVTRFEEYPYANGFKMLPDMELQRGNRWVPPPEVPNLPLMFGLVATRSA